MAVAQAIRFLNVIGERPDLRDGLYGCDGRDALFAYLKVSGFPFSGGEFEEAVDHVHCGCQTQEEADALMNRVTWMRLVLANA
ncbi:MAG TPA: Nif11-like leader peptide family natural product precursor [Fibrobacteria bacterium]|nr:Nif11-like leader peptide family natural product precursor [Fibrobacteria bacterium]